jgi:hypothetical protein
VAASSPRWRRSAPEPHHDLPSMSVRYGAQMMLEQSGLFSLYK